jgi:AcrR family transcriptional regulator
MNMSNPEPRRTRRAGGAKRTLVLDQVFAVLADRGYAGTRFIDVSEASGVAVSTLQGYFGSREDMLIEAMRRATSVAVADMNDFAARFDDPWQQLVAMVDRGLSTDVVIWRFLMEFWTAAAHDVELQEHAAALAEQYREPFIDAVRRGVESGAFTPRFDAAAIVEVAVANIVGLLYPVVLGHLAPQETDYRDVVLAQLAFALTSTDGASGVRPAPTTQER